MLWQPSLPERYTKADPTRLRDEIDERRERLGERLLILGHHYQVDEVIRHADVTGDSLKLCQVAAARAGDGSVEHVIFCGVHFMAETADMLTPGGVDVILPDLSAGCSMADMADYDDTVEAWELIHETLHDRHGGAWDGRIVPITYVNSSAAIKAFVGEHGGACCTSSNAATVFDWAMNGGPEPRRPGEAIKILFLPDQHLGRNTAASFGIDVDRKTGLYDPTMTAKGLGVGGMSAERVDESDVLLWAGHCSVHKLFRPEHCDEIRAAEPDRRILVHPECGKEVVDRADLSGSTGFIIKTLEAAAPGTKWAVGTEHNLVRRMSRVMAERGVDVRILSDCQCLCTTMYRIDEPHLLWVLDGLCGIGPDGEAIEPVARNVIDVPEAVRGPALRALDRMLELVPAAAGAG